MDVAQFEQRGVIRFVHEGQDGAMLDFAADIARFLAVVGENGMGGEMEWFDCDKRTRVFHGLVAATERDIAGQGDILRQDVIGIGYRECRRTLLCAYDLAGGKMIAYALDQHWYCRAGALLCSGCLWFWSVLRRRNVCPVHNRASGCSGRAKCRRCNLSLYIP